MTLNTPCAEQIVMGPLATWDGFRENLKGIHLLQLKSCDLDLINMNMSLNIEQEISKHQGQSYTKCE